MIDLTLITVCRNAEKTITRCLSAASQLLSSEDFSIEHIIVDGHSTDGTLELINSIVELPNRRVYSRLPNGVYDAMNFGISLARGRYVMFSNADDFVDANGLINLLSVIRNESFQPEVVHGLCFIHDPNGRVLRVQGTHSDCLVIGNMVEHPATLVKLDLIVKFKGFNCSYSYAADLELFIRMKQSGVGFQLLPYVVSHYFLGGLSSKKEAERERLSLLMSFNFITRSKYIHRLTKLLLDMRKR